MTTLTFHLPKALVRTLATGLLLCVAAGLRAQSVGLVMSGGGAKGITHIGVIKALEENDIPIDYVAGTSMGAIVAGLYADGMTTDEMIALIKSDEFHRWQTGDIEEENRYYFRQADPTPEILSINMHDAHDGSDRLELSVLPTNIVNPNKMNIALVELFSQSGALCGGNLDSLFVPFRSVASDIGGKGAYIWRHGDFGDAVRSSMSYPVMFRPVRTEDGALLIDGGIYNNFPVDIMQEDFHPGYIVGSSVSANVDYTDERDLFNIAQNLVMRHTDYDIPASEGILLQFHWDKISIWDFTVVDQLVRQGYDSTMAHMEEIKAAVSRRAPQAEVQARREQWQARKPEMRVRNIEVRGVNRSQRLYIMRSLRRGWHDGYYSLDELRHNYYRLISDNIIREVIPHTVYDTAANAFRLILDVKLEDRLKFMVGGHLANYTLNQIYLGARYQHLSTYEQTFNADVQIGQVYNSVSLAGRLDFAGRFYVRPQIVVHDQSFNDNSIDNIANDMVSNFRSGEAYARVGFGMPATMRTRWEVGFGAGSLSDRYSTLTNASVARDKPHSRYQLGQIYWNMRSNSLNGLMYPTEGTDWSLSAYLMGGRERHTEFYINWDEASIGLYDIEAREFWPQFGGRIERYEQLSSRFVLGWEAEAVYSMRPLLHNYAATIIQAPRFTPTPYSKAHFNPAYMANQYVAAGIKPVYKINGILQARLEAYAFVPVSAIKQVEDPAAESSFRPLLSRPEYDDHVFNEVNFMGELTLAARFKAASLGLFVNYANYVYEYGSGSGYRRDSRHSDWYVGLNVGVLLFQDRFFR